MTLQVPADARHEVKFVTSAVHRRRLEHWLLTHREGLSPSFPARQVSSIYFDTFDLETFQANLLGSSRRFKSRLRWYGDTNAPPSSTLEIKCRRNVYGWKRHWSIGELDLERMHWHEIRSTVKRQLPAQALYVFDALPQPVLINRYRRNYFESGDGRVRVTLDTDLTVFDQRFGSLPNLRRAANLPDVLVVEFKFSRMDRARAARVIEGFPVRGSRNSKYAIGVQAIAHSLS